MDVSRPLAWPFLLDCSARLGLQVVQPAVRQAGQHISWFDSSRLCTQVCSPGLCLAAHMTCAFIPWQQPGTGPAWQNRLPTMHIRALVQTAEACTSASKLCHKAAFCHITVTMVPQ